MEYTRRPFSIPLLLLAALVLAIGGVVAFASHASAATGDLTCTFDAVSTFSPPLAPGGTNSHFSSASVNFDCTSATTYQRLTSAVAQGSATAFAASDGNPCIGEFGIHGTEVFIWNTGERSTLDLEISAQGQENITVTSGPLTGDTLDIVPAANSTFTVNPDCATNGLQRDTETNFLAVFS